MPPSPAASPTANPAALPRALHRRLVAALEDFFTSVAPTDDGDTLIVAYSGGADSTALLALLQGLAPGHRWRIIAVHLDHALDAGSAARARHACAVARRLGAEWRQDRRSVEPRQRAGESPEAAARRVRYSFLEEARRVQGGRWIVTAHHLDDQAETVLLRCLQGSGWEGLAAIRPVRGRVVRPLLGFRRRQLEAWLRERTIDWIEDPTNRDLRVPRNRVRHLLLPALEDQARIAGRPAVATDLARLAATARRARATVERHLEAHLTPRRESAPGSSEEENACGPTVHVSRRALTALPAALLPAALALLHRRAGAPHPASAAARRELLRQLAAGGGEEGELGIDCGDGWRWRSEGDRVVLERRRRPTPVPRFTYTLEAPGEVIVEETGMGVRLTRQPVAPWMFRGAAHRAGLSLPLSPGDRVEIRNRRPGDRLRPLGSPGRRRLKEVLIDRGVPRRERDRLPLLLVDGRLAWVPGVTVDHAFRLPRRGTVWVAELFPAGSGINAPREPLR